MPRIAQRAIQPATVTVVIQNRETRKPTVPATQPSRKQCHAFRAGLSGRGTIQRAQQSGARAIHGSQARIRSGRDVKQPPVIARQGVPAPMGAVGGRPQQTLFQGSLPHRGEGEARASGGIVMSTVTAHEAPAGR